VNPPQQNKKRITMQQIFDAVTKYYGRCRFLSDLQGKTPP